MKLRIKKIQRVYATNIFGKPIETRTYYCIYQRTIWGKKLLYYKPVGNGKFNIVFNCESGPLCDFSNPSDHCCTFKTHGSAANFIKGIMANPDNYIQGYILSEYLKAMLPSANSAGTINRVPAV